jgi:hypothetical protein
MPGRMTRRSAMELLGAGALVIDGGSRPAGLDGGSRPAGLDGGSRPQTPGQSGPPQTPGAEAVQVPAALRVGAAFGRWTIAAVHPIERGVLRVDVHDRQGHEFALELMARDPSAGSRPPAEVGALAIYVCNGGDGWLPTVEEQGLAAMTLARLLEKHDQTGPIAGLLTHGQRVVAHADVLHAAFTAPA